MILWTYFGATAIAQQPLTNLDLEQENHVIPVGAKEEYNNVNLNNKNSVLTVNGTLIIHGNLDMIANKSEFTMGPEAIVVIYGDFLSSNSVTITAKSYLIVYGNFVNKTPSNKADLNIEGSNIYIFGTVDNWENFTSCDQYEGNSAEITVEQCDYGTEENFDENSGEFPEDLKDILPCVNSIIWTGASDSNWNNLSNWNCNKLPSLAINVVIPSGLATYPEVTTGANALAKNLTIETDAEVVVVNNFLRIAGNLLNSGILNVEAGSISFEGSTPQIIPAGAFEGNRVLNLNINNPEEVVSQTKIEVNNSLKIGSGVFSTGEDLTLISTQLGTAFIDGSGNGEITGSIKMQRYLSNGFGYKYFSSPFSDSTVGDFAAFMELKDATTGFPHFYEYRENRKNADLSDLTGWQNFTEPTNSLKIAEGYALNISENSNPVTIEISGTVNNGSVTISLQNNDGRYTNGFNLVGNPYPSPIDWDLISPTLSGIDNAIYFFTAGSSDRYLGTYTSYVNGVSTDGRSSGIIPSMQGFFVRVSDPANGAYPATANLNFTNAARTGNQNGQDFYKSENSKIIPQLRLSAAYSNEETSDAAIIYFHPAASAQFENKLDAYKMMNTAAEVPNLYSITKQGEKLSINAINSSEIQEIPLGIKSERSGDMFIEMSGKENIFPAAYIYLKDKKNKLIQNLSEKPRYFFTSQKGENNDRFFLIISPEKLSDKDMILAFEQFSVYSVEGELLIKLNLDENSAGNVILSNISGQILRKSSGKGKDLIQFRGIAAPGVYLISLELENERMTKKFLLNK